MVDAYKALLLAKISRLKAARPVKSTGSPSKSMKQAPGTAKAIATGQAAHLVTPLTDEEADALEEMILNSEIDLDDLEA